MKKKGNKRQLIKTTWYDSLAYTLMPYEEYKEICEENEWEVCEEDSTGYWKDIWHLTENDWDDFRANMEYSPFAHAQCMITGALGLWHGNPTIVPVLCDGLMAAIDKCLSGNYDKEFVIEQHDGFLEVTVSHHDGTNCFEIHLLSKKGEREVARPIYQWEKDYDPKPWWFKKIYGYLF